MAGEPWLDYQQSEVPKKPASEPVGPWSEYQPQSTPVVAQVQAPAEEPWKAYQAPGVLDYAKESAGAVLRGGAATLGSTLQGYGAGQPEAARQEIAQLESINTPLPENATPEERAAFRQRRAVQHPSDQVIDERVATRLPMANTKAKDTGLYKAGEAVSGAFGESQKILHPLVEDVLGGVGSVGTNILTSLVPVAGPALAVASALGQGSGEAAERAIKAGATEKQIAQSTGLGQVPGATEFVDALLPKLGSTGKVLGFVKRVGLRVIEGALVEGGQEGVQQLMQNAIAKGIYKPEQDLTEDVARSALIGAIVGGAASGVLGRSDHEAPHTPASQQEVDDALKGLMGHRQPDPIPAEGTTQQLAAVRTGTPTVSDAPIAGVPPSATPEAPVGVPSSAVAPGAPSPEPVPSQPIVDNTPLGDILLTPSGMSISQVMRHTTFELNNDLLDQTREAATAEVLTDMRRQRNIAFAPREIAAQVAAEPDIAKQDEILRQFRDAQHVQLVGQMSQTEREIRESDPTEGSHKNESEVPGLQAEMDFGSGASIVPTHVSQKVPGLPPGVRRTEVGQYADGKSFILESLHVATADDWLQDIHPDPIDGEVHSLVFNLVRDRLRQVVPDVPIHIVTDEEFNRTSQPKEGSQTLAVFMTPDSIQHEPFIMIRASMLSDPRSMAHLVQHEVVHAATVRLIKADARLRSQVRSVMNYTLKYLNDTQYNRVAYAFTNEKEFIAEVMSNGQLQHFLSQMTAPYALKKELDLLSPRSSMWQAFVRMFQKILGLDHEMQTYTMLEAALRIGSRIIDTQAQLPLDPARPAQADYVDGIKKNRQAIRDVDHTADPLQAVGTQDAIAGIHASMDALFGPKLPPQAAGAAGHADRINWIYKITAGLDHLARSNPNFLPLIEYMGLVKKMHQEEVSLHDAGVKILKDVAHLGKQGERLMTFIDEVMHMRYRSPIEVTNGIVRHPSSQEFQALVKKYDLGKEAIDVFNKMNSFMVGGPLNQQNTGGFLGLIEQSITERIMKTDPDPASQARKIQKLNAQVQNLRKRPYFPFTNFGLHYVAVKDPAGKLIGYSSYERKGLSSAREQQARGVNDFARKWEQDYGSAPVIGKDIVYGVHPEHVAPLLGLPSVLLGEISNLTELTDAQINTASDLILAESLDQTPMLGARYQKRFYVPGYGMDVEGYSTDVRRAFARFVFNGAKFYTRTKYLSDLRGKVREAENTVGSGNKEGQVARFMHDHLQNTIINSKGDWGALKGAVFFYAMGYVPAAATQNLAQMPMITFPFLSAKFGTLRSTKALSKAMADVKNVYQKKAVYSSGTSFEHRAISYGITSGRITETQAPEIAGMAQARLLQLFGGNALQKGWQGFIKHSATMFELAEQFNRRVTYRAALDLALQNPTTKYIDKAVKLHQTEYNDLLAKFTPAQARAIVAASDVIDQTQYIYARWARPRFMRGKLLGSIFIFKKYVQSTAYMLGQNPDVLWRYALISMFLSGLNGLPFSEDLQSILNALGTWMFGRDFNLEREARRYIQQVAGDELPADLVFHGLARRGFGIPAILDLLGSFATGTPGRGLAAPIVKKDPTTGEFTKEGYAWKNVPFPVLDRSRALSMGMISPLDIGKLMQPGNDVNKTIADQAQHASGAVFSVGFNMYKAATDNQYGWGDPKRWERAVPRLLGDISQAFRSYREGRERIHGGPNAGTTVLTYDTRDPEQMMEILFQAGGYNTLRSQAKWDQVIAESEREKYWQGTRQGLIQQMHEAFIGQDQREIDSARDAIMKFNSNLPEYAQTQALDDKTLSGSIKQRETIRAKREIGIPLQNRNIQLNEDTKKLFPESTIDVRQVR